MNYNHLKGHKCIRLKLICHYSNHVGGEQLRNFEIIISPRIFLSLAYFLETSIVDIYI